MQTRDVTLDDVPELRVLIDAQESSLDSDHKPAHDAWPRELVKGHFGVARNQVWCDDVGKILAWASMQPDAHRQRVEIELFRQPGFEHMVELWDWCLKLGDNEFAGWVLWPTCHWRDEEVASLFRVTGFNLVRKYHILTRSVDGDEYPELPHGAQIRLIATPDDFLELHSAHQDAFSQHFGFTPRPAPEWIEHFRDYDAVDPNGRFLLQMDDQTVGFVTCVDDNAELGGGFIQLLGVRHAYQGRGLGEILLRWGIAYCASRGFTAVDLTVDTGNESGALALYDKLSFRRLTEFHLYAR